MMNELDPASHERSAPSRGCVLGIYTVYLQPLCLVCLPLGLDGYTDHLVDGER